MTEQNPESSPLSRASQQFERTLPILTEVAAHMQQTHVHLLSISQECVNTTREVQLSTRRQTGLLALLCLACTGALYLAWQLAQVEAQLRQVTRDLADVSRTASAGQEQLTEMPRVLELLHVQTARLEQLQQGLPQVTVDARGRLRLDMPATAVALRAAARLQSPTAPTNPSGRVQVPLE